MNAATQTQHIAGIGAIAERYDVFILDQYGVLHDGKTPYPGVADCLGRLARAGKTIVVLSNSAKRAAHNLTRLGKLGVPTSPIAKLVSSGEAFHAAMRPGGALAAEGWRRARVIAMDADRTLLADVGLVETQDLGAADLLLVVGIDSPRVSVAALEPLLAEACARDLPMVCANADVTRVDPAGLFEGPGAVAQRYETLGGRVHWFGKPHREIFDAAFAAIGGRGGRRSVMVGDSISHDVLGARNAGIDAALILAGIHREQLLGVDAATQRANLATLCARHRATPDYVLESFAWS